MLDFGKKKEDKSKEKKPVENLFQKYGKKQEKPKNSIANENIFTPLLTLYIRLDFSTEVATFMTQVLQDIDDENNLRIPGEKVFDYFAIVGDKVLCDIIFANNILRRTEYTYQDLILLIFNFCTLDSKRLADFVFQCIDTQGVGFVERDELQEFTRKLHSDLDPEDLEDLCKQIKRSVASTRTGYVAIEDFRRTAKRVKDLLYPVIEAQSVLISGFMGKEFWEEQSKKRSDIIEDCDRPGDTFIPILKSCGDMTYKVNLSKIENLLKQSQVKTMKRGSRQGTAETDNSQWEGPEVTLSKLTGEDEEESDLETLPTIDTDALVKEVPIITFKDKVETDVDHCLHKLKNGFFDELSWDTPRKEIPRNPFEYREDLKFLIDVGRKEKELQRKINENFLTRGAEFVNNITDKESREGSRRNRLQGEEEEEDDIGSKSLTTRFSHNKSTGAYQEDDEEEYSEEQDDDSENWDMDAYFQRILPAKPAMRSGAWWYEVDEEEESKKSQEFLSRKISFSNMLTPRSVDEESDFDKEEQNLQLPVPKEIADILEKFQRVKTGSYSSLQVAETYNEEDFFWQPEDEDKSKDSSAVKKLVRWFYTKFPGKD